jgi:hypothetical protein
MVSDRETLFCYVSRIVIARGGCQRGKRARGVLYGGLNIRKSWRAPRALEVSSRRNAEA